MNNNTYSIVSHEQVTHRVTISLTETEVSEILMATERLLTQLRQERRNWETPTRGKSKSRSGETECPKCGRFFKRLGRHVATCPGPEDPKVPDDDN